jgi:hypothetical protein
MVCKGCGERLYGQAIKLEYCKACRQDRAAASLPSVSTQEDVMADEQTVPEAPKALPELPEGYRYLYNRGSEPYEAQFDGKVYILDPHETKTLQCHIAEHLRAYSIIPGTLRQGRGGYKAERWLALGPGWTILRHNKVESGDAFGNAQYVPEYGVAEPEETFQVPTETKAGREIFDRTSIPNYVDRAGQEGRATHVEYVRT